jgi:hypothetical protein
MTKDEALKMCLEYIETNAQGSKFAILIKEALAQSEPEYVAFMDTPHRPWVGLTKEERHEISMANRPYCADVMAAHEEELKRRNT